VAWALYAAGAALSRPDWRLAAIDSLAADLADIHRPVESSLCHGWAGVLMITWRIARASGDQRLAKQVPHLVGPILGGYDPALPFGYRYRAPGLRVAGDRAGLLEGAAGIALALHAYATDTEPVTGWDAALLLS
jgi:hypothetical protein